MTKQWSKRAQAAHRKKWIAALESGEFKQTRCRLHDTKTGGFCCLGVACEISGLGKWDEQGVYRVNEHNYNDAVLPTAVMGWLGLSHSEGAWRAARGTIDDERFLTGLNDHGKRFKTIARIIRENEAALIGAAP